MATNFPTTLDSYAAKVDNVDTVRASHVNNLQDAVVALENELGSGALRATPNVTANTIAKRDANGILYANRYGAIITSTSATTTITTGGGWTPIIFDTATWQYGSVWSNSFPTRLYAPVAGVYFISGELTFPSNATGFRGTAIRLNGATFVRAHFVPAVTGFSHHVPSASRVLLMAAGDYVEILGAQTSGVGLVIDLLGSLSPVAEMILL